MRIEDAKEVIVGKIYDVPVSESILGGLVFKKGEYFPTLGSPHSDPEIGADYQHIHVDWRFVSKSQFKRSTRRVGRQDRGQEYVTVIVIKQESVGFPKRMKMRCKRIAFEFPMSDSVGVPLQKIYASAVDKCNICPHRGISLVGAPVVNGARVCPGHGLAWNLETGKMQPR